MKYPFHVFQMQGDGRVVWVADSTQLKGCTGQGDTPEEAIAELAENEAVWLETAEESGIPIPGVSVSQPREYSGRVTLRISPAEHERAAAQAKRQRISLNQYLNDAVVAYNSRIETENRLMPARNLFGNKTAAYVDLKFAADPLPTPIISSGAALRQRSEYFTELFHVPPYSPSEN